ncbi:hypothetical protein IFR05_007528 [Cadophora sp. M221]|nr:hypothetical protein IFR05_007528 [Cadophora sp. M221]
MGSRHILDTAPFLLWDEEIQDFTKPTPEQLRWIHENYKSVGGTFVAPFLIVATSTPSLPGHNGQISLTLGCCTVIFMPPDMFENSITGFGLPATNGRNLIGDDINDLLRGVVEIPKWQPRPPKDCVKAVFQILHEFCTPVAVNFMSPCIIVELSTESTCKGGTLPGLLAGRKVHYHVGSYWDEPTMRGKLRNIQAEDWANFPRGDTTNYLRRGRGILGPGVRVEGATISSSSGVRIKKGTEVRVMLAAHAVQDSRYIYHPDGDNGENIADIVERYPEDDWALAKIVPNVTYSNSEVFETPIPTRLVRGEDIQHLPEWNVCDGMTTGKIAMRYAGSRWLQSENDPLHLIDLSNLVPASVWYGMFPAGGADEIRDGICGSPIINESSGGVIGSFQYLSPNEFLENSSYMKCALPLELQPWILLNPEERSRYFKVLQDKERALAEDIAEAGQNPDIKVIEKKLFHRRIDFGNRKIPHIAKPALILDNDQNGSPPQVPTPPPEAQILPESHEFVVNVEHITRPSTPKISNPKRAIIILDDTPPRSSRRDQPESRIKPEANREREPKRAKLDLSAGINTGGGAAVLQRLRQELRRNTEAIAEAEKITRLRLEAEELKAKIEDLEDAKEEDKARSSGNIGNATQS